MRFIRDIIKEQRGEASSPRRPAPEAPQPVQPLVLDTPAAPQGAPATAPQPEPAETTLPPVMQEQTEARFETAPAVNDHAETAPEPLPASNADQGSFTAAPAAEDTSLEAESNTAETDEPLSDAAETSDAADDLNLGETPFEKLLDSAPQETPGRKPVSPMRSAAPSAPQQTEKTLTDAQAAELEALKPAADVMATPVTMPGPAKGRGSARSGRVKTRLLGFSAGSLESSDPFEKKPSTPAEFPVGWLVVISDMGRGASFALHDGVSKVGRGVDQTVSLNFGDNSISRDNHVSIAYDAEQNKFFIGHSGKTNLVRVNNVPLLSTEELKSKDVIRLGETTLRFMAFCADEFSWAAEDEKVAKHA